VNEVLDFDERVISFWVPGIPKPGGSKTFKGLSRRTGRAILVDASGAAGKNWRAVVGWYGMKNAPKELFSSALEVTFDFVMPRPKYHYRKDGSLKLPAPEYHVVAPDTTKLIRSTEDALKGIIWRDDSIIARQHGSKRFGERPGCQLVIKQLP
jgi:Holliday junction resolvase RusA-like endonuclease